MSSLVRMAVIVLLTAAIVAGQGFRGGGLRGGGSRSGFRAGGFHTGARGGPGFRPGGSLRYGFGQRVYPGMPGRHPGWHHGSFGRWHFGFRGYRAGFYPYGAYGYWPTAYGYWPTVAAPYAYPLYSYPAYSDGYAATPNVVVVYIPTEAAPREIPQPRSQERKESEQPKEAQPNSQGGSAGPGTAGLRNRPPAGTLLAFKSGAVYLTIAEWRNGDSIHFVNRDGRQMAMPLETFDYALTEQLNRERHVKFRLNAAE